MDYFQNNLHITNRLYHSQNKTTLTMNKIFKMIHDNIIDHNNLQFICFDSGINNIKALSVFLFIRAFHNCVKQCCTRSVIAVLVTILIEIVFDCISHIRIWNIK